MSALVKTSRTFPSTTACTDTTEDVPALEAEKSLSTSRSVDVRRKPRSSRPSPRPPHRWGFRRPRGHRPTAPAALAARNASAPDATRAGFTTTVMPSAIALVGDGCTRTADVSVMPSSSSRSWTESTSSRRSAGAVDDEGHVLAEGRGSRRRRPARCPPRRWRPWSLGGSASGEPWWRGSATFLHVAEEGLAGKRLMPDRNLRAGCAP